VVNAFARTFQHVYEGDQAIEFVASRPASALCGYVAQGKGQEVVGRCPECTQVILARRGITWHGTSESWHT